jgi:hypothetical protein
MVVSESPYIINQTITVFSGVHLIIEPGVALIFTSSTAGLTVEGQ